MTQPSEIQSDLNTEIVADLINGLFSPYGFHPGSSQVF